MTKVTEREFVEFLVAYPRPLIREVLTICEPPQIQFHDRTLGIWPESVVASYDADNGGLEGYKLEYRIKRILK